MALKSKAKPAAKGKTTKATATKKKATKASEETAAPSKPAEILEEGTFVAFTGYKSAQDMPKDEIIFKEGDTLYIVEVEEDEDGVAYGAINAEDLATFLESGLDEIEGGQVSPSEVRPLKGGALVKAEDTFMPIRQVGKMEELLAEHDGSAVETAVALNEQIAENYFYLGGALAEVLRSGAYLKENGGDFSGDDAFHEFCQATFDFKGSKGRALARIYHTFSKIEGFEPSMIEGIGWSKAAIAERFVTEDNLPAILETASTTTQRELALELSDKYAKDNTTTSGRAASRGPSIVRTTLKFTLEENAAETVTLAIQHGMKQTGVQDESLMLEMICSEWAEEHLETKSHKAAIAKKTKAAAAARNARESGDAPAKAPAKRLTKK
jgi:hypothetical protein